MRSLILSQCRDLRIGVTRSTKPADLCTNQIAITGSMTQFCLPTASSSPNLTKLHFEFSDDLEITRRGGLRYYYVKLFSDYLSVCDHNLPTLQSDGQTTSHGNMASRGKQDYIDYLHSFIRGCLPKSRNHAKFQQNLTLQQFKVIQGHRSWCQSKAHVRTTSYQSLIVTLAVSATVFQILTLKARKSQNFSDLPFFEAPVRGEPLRIW